MAPSVNVWFRGKWYGPSYPDAGNLPAGRANPPDVKVTGEAAAETQVVTTTDGAPAAMAPPPKAGPGSSKAKWAAYAAANNVEVPAGADRDDIIAACQAAGVPVDQHDNT